MSVCAGWDRRHLTHWALISSHVPSLKKQVIQHFIEDKERDANHVFVADSKKRVAHASSSGAVSHRS